MTVNLIAARFIPSDRRCVNVAANRSKSWDSSGDDEEPGKHSHVTGDVLDLVPSQAKFLPPSCSPMTVWDQQGEVIAYLHEQPEYDEFADYGPDS